MHVRRQNFQNHLYQLYLKNSVKVRFYVIFATFNRKFKTHPEAPWFAKFLVRKIQAPHALSDAPNGAFCTLPTPFLICILRFTISWQRKKGKIEFVLFLQRGKLSNFLIVTTAGLETKEVICRKHGLALEAVAGKKK